MKSFKDYPKLVDVESMNWEVRFKRKLFHEGKEVDGLCDYEEKVIYIRIKKDRCDMFRVFIHEVLHAIEYENDHDIPHKYIEQIDTGLAKFMRKNIDKLIKIIV